MPLGSFVVALACLLVLTMSALAPARAFAADPQEKHDEPTVTHLVQENRDGVYRMMADWPQGTHVPFKATGTMAAWLEDVSPYEYWVVAEPESTLEYVAGSARVTLVRADGTKRDVTASLTVSEVGGAVVAGSPNLRAAIRDLRPDDQLVLDYECTYASSYNLGFGAGNASYAHVEYTPNRASTRPMPARAKAAPAMRAQAADPRSSGLASSPEIRATAYCYALDITKVAGDTRKPLPGASFALRDGEGLYYVEGAQWTNDALKATSMTSDGNGKVLFTGLDHDSYELVETQAPKGYAKAGPIDIAIETGVDEEETTIRASSKSVTITNANSTTGTIGFNVADPPDGSGGGGSGNDNPSGDDGPSGDGPGGKDAPSGDGPGGGGDSTDGGSGSGSDGGSGGQGDKVRPAGGLVDALMTATGDPVTLVGLALLVLGAATLVVVAARRNRQQ